MLLINIDYIESNEKYMGTHQLSFTLLYLSFELLFTHTTELYIDLPDFMLVLNIQFIRF